MMHRQLADTPDNSSLQSPLAEPACLALQLH